MKEILMGIDSKRKQELFLIIKDCWDKFQLETPRDSLWIKEFEKFQQSEPYASSFKEYWSF